MSVPVQEDRRFGSPPARTWSQQREALQKGNEVRSARAVLKRDVKAGRRSALDVLAEPPAYAETMKVFDLLIAVPKYGRVKVNKVLQLARVSPSKTLGGMTERQRFEVASMVRR